MDLQSLLNGPATLSPTKGPQRKDIMNSKLRLKVASVSLIGTALLGVGAANAQTSTVPVTKGTTVPAAGTAAGHRGPGGPGGPAGHGAGFQAHAATIAKLLNMTTADLQTAMQTRSLAQIAADKGVSVQTIIDAYVAEEKAEHPDMTAADVVARVTNMVNNVRPAPPADGQARGGQPGTRPARGAKGAAPTGAASGGTGTSAAKATVKA